MSRSALKRSNTGRGCSWMVLLGVLFASLLLANSVLVYGICVFFRNSASMLQNSKVFQAVVFAGTVILLGVEVMLVDRWKAPQRKRER